MLYCCLYCFFFFCIVLVLVALLVAWRSVVVAITLYCCICFFVSLFLFLLLLLLSVVCRQCLLSLSFGVRRHPLAPSSPSCCYHSVLLFLLFRVVSRCFALFRVVVVLVHVVVVVFVSSFSWVGRLNLVSWFGELVCCRLVS